jgi:pimeloyl-ACP methyl ester carboxylesterase
MRVWVLAFFLACGAAQVASAKTYLLTFTGYSISPSGEACGGQDVYPENVSFSGSGMLEIIQRLRPLAPVSELEMRAFTFFNTGAGLACTAPFDGEADHRAAEAFLTGRVTPSDRVIVAGHSYGAHRALLFADQFQRKFGRSVTALLLADAIDWTECSIRGVLSGTGGTCRQQGLTLDLSPTIVGARTVWNYRQERGLRVLFFTLPILTGYQVTVGGAPVRAFVLNTTHTDVDDSVAVQSTLSALVLGGSISMENSADALEFTTK